MIIDKTFDSVSSSIFGIINGLSTGGRNQLLNRTGQELLKHTRDNFGETGPNRTIDWKPLSKQYAKRVGGNNTPTLFRTGNLFRSISLTAPKGDYITMMVTVPYGGYNQYGTRNIPARPFIPIENAGSPFQSRLNSKVEYNMLVTIHRNLSLLTNGNLPNSIPSFARSSYEAGNPFSNSI